MFCQNIDISVNLYYTHFPLCYRYGATLFAPHPTSTTTTICALTDNNKCITHHILCPAYHMCTFNPKSGEMWNYIRIDSTQPPSEPPVCLPHVSCLHQPHLVIIRTWVHAIILYTQCQQEKKRYEIMGIIIMSAMLKSPSSTPSSPSQLVRRPLPPSVPHLMSSRGNFSKMAVAFLYRNVISAENDFPFRIDEHPKATTAQEWISLESNEFPFN